MNMTKKAAAVLAAFYSTDKRNKINIGCWTLIGVEKWQRKTKRSNKKDEWKRILRFELIGLFLLALTLIAMAGLGAVGQALVLVVRLFIGEWYMLCLIGMVILSVYIIWKREMPPLVTRQLIGTYLIILSILLFSHVTLFENLSKNGTFTDPSVIMNTWDLYMLEATGQSNHSDLGEG